MSGLEKNIKNFAEAVSVMKEYQDPDICLEAAQFITSRAMADKNSAPEAIKELALLVENEDRSIPLRRKALNEIKKIAAWHLECLPEITGNFAFLAGKEGLPMILRQESIKMIADIAATHSKSATEAVEILTLFAGNKTTNAVLRRQAVAGLGCIAASYEKSGGLLIQKTASLLSGDPDPSLAFLGCTLISDTVPDEKCNQSFFLRAARKSFSFWKENWSLSADVAGKFYKDITEKINSIDARASLAILQKMPLPIPDEGEFLDGVGCQIIFLTRYGLTIKIMDEKQTEAFEQAFDNDLVLQPLKYIRLSAGSFSIFPGIHIHENVSISDAYAAGRFLNDEAREMPVKFIDQQMENIGFLPVPWVIDGKETKFPVILDHGCIVVKNEKSLTDSFQQACYRGIQDSLYGNMKLKLDRCWPDNEFPDPVKMREFLDECAAIVAKPKDDPDKILISGWIQNEEREDSKTRSAPRYEQRLAKFHKFTAV